MKSHVLVFAVAAALVSFACGGDDPPDSDPTITDDAGSGGAADASANATTGDAGFEGGSDAGSDAAEEIVPAESTLCLGGSVKGPEGCVDSEVLEIELYWSPFIANGPITINTFRSGESEDFEPDLRQPINAFCFYEETLQSPGLPPTCTDIGTISFELAGQSEMATYDPVMCYGEGGAPKPFQTATIDVSWAGGADAESGMMTGLAPAVPTIDVGFATNGNFRVVREEGDGYDGPMSFKVSQFDGESGVSRSINCYTPGNETVVVSAEDVEEFGGFAGASWTAEFREVSFNDEGATPVRLLNFAQRSGRLPE